MYKSYITVISAMYVATLGCASASDAFVMQIGAPVQATVSVPQVNVSTPDLVLSVPQPRFNVSDIRAMFSGYGLPSASADANVSDLVQIGNDNFGGILQNGLGNAASVVQTGDSNTGWLTQTGNGNSAAMYQTGIHLSAKVAQFGNGNRAIIVQSN